MTSVAAVVIGRNEAEKLPCALRSLVGAADPIVYVDSGSTDGSAEIAHGFGVDVVNLDPRRPFSVARGRNEGYRRALALAPDTVVVQFVDADSEICPGWLPRARRAFDDDARVAAVFGRIREKEPGRSIFNRLYEAEFNAHFRQADACPGICMMRVRAIVEAGGFEESMRGFEDTELSFRFRAAGWHIERLDIDMAIHDARMSTARNWWNRHVRSGFATGQVKARHAGSHSRYGLRQYWSVWFWGFLIPAATLLAAIPSRGWSALLLGAYPWMIGRIRRRYLRLDPGFSHPGLYAASTMTGKIPEAIGLTRFELSRLVRERARGPVA